MQATEVSDYADRLLQTMQDISRIQYQTYDFTYPADPIRWANSNYAYKIFELRNLFLKTINDFTRKYGAEKKAEDEIYRKFVDLVGRVLVNSGKRAYDDNEFDSNMVYIVAILGLLHPVHISIEIDTAGIVRKCLEKYFPIPSYSFLSELKTVTRDKERNKNGVEEHKDSREAKLEDLDLTSSNDLDAVSSDDLDTVSSDELTTPQYRKHMDDTLFYYMLYAVTRENDDPWGYPYFRDHNQHYRSGVVYHLLEGGCRVNDKCLDLIFSLEHSERAVQMIKDYIFIMPSVASFQQCRITQYAINHCFRDHAPWQGGPMFTSAIESLMERENFMFWELAQMNIFCRHHKCLDWESMLAGYASYGIIDERKMGVLSAMRITTKPLTQLCRETIRRTLNSSKAVNSCRLLNGMPPKLKDFIAFKSLDCAIKPFYSMCDMNADQVSRIVGDVPRHIKHDVMDPILDLYNVPARKH